MKRIISLTLTFALAATMLSGCAGISISTPGNIDEKVKEEVKEELKDNIEDMKEDLDDLDEDIKEELDDWEKLVDDDKDKDSDEGETVPYTDSIQDDLLSIRYNGFLTAEYTCPEDIDWDEVLYLGAGIRTDEFKEVESKLEKMYSEEAGYDVTEYGGIDIFKSDDVDKFIKDTSGVEPEDVNFPPHLTYYDKWDVYVSSSATDTNQVDVQVTKVTEKDGVYTVDYNSFDVPMQVKMLNNGESWQFISNLWNPEEGRDKAVQKKYDSILDDYAKALCGNLSEEQIKADHFNDMVEMYQNLSDPLLKVGYAFYDIDGDKMDELVIGEITDAKKPTVLIDVFSYRCGNFTKVWDIDGGERDRFYLADDRTVYEESSSGAKEMTLINHNISAAGPYINLFVKDAIIYSEDAVGGARRPWYYADGYDYTSKETWEKISEEEFNDYWDYAEDSYVHIDLTPFIEREDS